MESSSDHSQYMKQQFNKKQGINLQQLKQSILKQENNRDSETQKYIYDEILLFTHIQF